MYRLPTTAETRHCHEGTTVTVRALDSYKFREGFVTHINRSEEQIAEAVEYMFQVQRTRLEDDLK